MKYSLIDNATGAILAKLGRYKPTPQQWSVLGQRLLQVVVEDNRKGVLSGLDKDGNPMAPVRYRTGGGVKARFRSANSERFGTTSGRFKGRTGKRAKLIRGLKGGSLPNNNLTTSEYKKLTGPPLAPRREQSRVITNLEVRSVGEPDGLVVEGRWRDVLSAKGVPFLRYHFRGGKRLPKRDLRGVRPEGRRLARRMVLEWFRWVTGAK